MKIDVNYTDEFRNLKIRFFKDAILALYLTHRPTHINYSVC